MVKKLKIIFLLFALLITQEGYAMFFSNDTGQFKKLLGNIPACNQYILAHKSLELSWLYLEKQDISGIHFIGTTIKHPRWKKTKINRSEFVNTEIHGGHLTDVDFSNSSFHKVVFQGVSFDNVMFDYSKLQDVKFINCSFKRGSFYQLAPSGINFNDTKINEGDFRRAEANLAIINSHFDDVDFSNLKANNFIMQNGLLKEAIFDKAHFGNFSLTHVKVDDVGIDDGSAKNIYVANARGELNFGATASKVGYISIYNSNAYFFSAADSTIGKLVISNCGRADGVVFFDAQIKDFKMKNCHANDLHFAGANIENLILTDVSTKESFSSKLHVSAAQLNDVVLSGTIDFSNVIIKKLQVKNFKLKDDTKIKTKDSNIEITPHGIKLKENL